MTVKEGDQVRVHYTGKVAGKVFDSTNGAEPFLFRVGDGAVIEGFDQAVLGMKIGDKVCCDIDFKRGYGPRDERLITEITMDKLGDLPDQVKLEPGVSFELKDKLNNKCIATVNDVFENGIVLDLNHPLAGKDLSFDIELVDILNKVSEN